MKTLKELIERLLLRRKDQFAPEAIQGLAKAAELSSSRNDAGQNGRIRESDLLRVLVDDPIWQEAEKLGLPPAKAMREKIEELEQSGIVDPDGIVLLEGLDPTARDVIASAHNLAQQWGTVPITNRILLLAFLAKSSSHASRVLKSARISRTRVVAAMAVLLDKAAPRQFGLSAEACSRIVTPVLRQARALAKNDRPVTERDLFVAFCMLSAEPFKEFLQKFLNLNLDELKHLEPAEHADDDQSSLEEPEMASSTADSGGGRAFAFERFHPAQFAAPVWMGIQRACDLALRDGWPDLRTPHLFRAMLEIPEIGIADALADQGYDPLQVHSILRQGLIRGRQLKEPAGKMPVSENSESILVDALRRAHDCGREQVLPEDFFEAFFASGGSIVGALLKKLKPSSSPPTPSEDFEQ